MTKRSREDFEPSLSPELITSPSDSTHVRIIELASKFQHTSTDSGEPSSSSVTTTTEMKCSLPPHKQTLSFPTFEEYEVHYAKEHTHRCVECRKNFPTGHFLNLHIEENHDSLVAVRRERGEKTYQCFVSDCDKVCSTPQKRRMHLMAKHMFPQDYDFYIVNDGIDRRSSMLRSGRHRRRSSAAVVQVEEARRRDVAAGQIEESKEKRQLEEGDEDDDMHESATQPQKIVAGKADVGTEKSIDDLVSGMSALKFIPPSVRFGRGRGRGRGGFSKT